MTRGKNIHILWLGAGAALQGSEIMTVRVATTLCLEFARSLPLFLL